MRRSVSESEVCSCSYEVVGAVLADCLVGGLGWVDIEGCVRLCIRDVCWRRLEIWGRHDGLPKSLCMCVS